MIPDSPSFAISVLIRTFNSEKTLGRVLAHLSPAEGDEILIVDSGSTDSTMRIARSYKTILVEAPRPFNYSKSLNAGFRVAKNAWVLVLSSHSLPTMPDLLERFRTAARSFPPDVVVGYGPSFFDGGECQPVETTTFYGGESFSEVYGYCSNRNTLYRRNAWDQFPFDEQLRTAEDKAWAVELIQKGWKMALVPDASTLNINRYSFRYMFIKGYSEVLALPHRPMTWWELFLTLRSLSKRPFFYKTPLGTWLRMYALALGRFVASRREQDNRPWTTL